MPEGAISLPFETPKGLRRNRKKKNRDYPHSSPMLSLRVPPELKDMIDLAAAAAEISRSAFIIRILEKHLGVGKK